ncbi:NADPH-dependent FMN reductase [Ferrovibrio xuzhouensis]|uniref:NADPH-dependent FMN reductase n=1 Tax=Ferrovibrio xuzhouensis TaxID=1576914 RepID=A0ABV7VDV0_9PROT
MRLLALSGSLRAASTNTALLRAAAAAAPAGMTVEIYDGLGRLPVFNPDDDEGPGPAPAPVADFRRRLGAADALLVACPEYAHGVPGGLKNALDWVVASGELVDKPAALLHASPRSAVSRAALAEILVTMSVRLVNTDLVTLPLLGLGPAELAALLDRPDSRERLRQALAGFAAAVTAPASFR